MTLGQRLAALNEADHWRARAVLRNEWVSSGLHKGRLMPDMIRECVDASPDTKIIFGSAERPCSTTTGALLAESYGIARAFQRLGLVEGDAVVVQVPNWKECALTMLAAMHLGLIFVPMMHTLGAAEIEYVLRKSDARAFVVPDRWKKIDYGARLGALGDLPELKHVIVIGDEEMPRPVVRWSALNTGGHEPMPRLTASPDDPWLIIFTSGTTAAPKGAVLTHNAFASEVANFPMVRSASGTPEFHPFPSGHAAGVIMTLRPLLMADPMILMDAFDEDVAVTLVREHQSDRAAGVPLMVQAYLRHADEVFPDGLRQILIGATSVSPTLMELCEAQGWAATRCYGCTEHLTISGSYPTDPKEKRMMTDGRLMPGVQVRLVDENEQPVPVGEPGEIVSMGPELFKGYLDPEHNATAFDRDGWFRTGDIGVLDEDGYIRIVDRKKDIIIRGGENISSKEIEDVMMQHAAVSEVAAVAWPDEALGERVAVFVKVADGLTLTLDDIRAHFAEAGLSRQKAPERLVLVAELPRNAMGKVLKPDLRKQVLDLIEQERVKT